MPASTTTFTFPPQPLETLKSTYRMLDKPDDPRHERLLRFLSPEQFHEDVRHWAVPFETLGRQLLRSLPPGPDKRTALRYLVEAQMAAVQAHDSAHCYYCQRAMENCGCKPGAVR